MAIITYQSAVGVLIVSR